jgi:hypothetical protein
MNGPGLVLAFLVIAIVAIAVSGSVWGGVIVAALELGFWGVTRYLRGGRRFLRS